MYTEDGPGAAGRLGDAGGDAGGYCQPLAYSPVISRGPSRLTSWFSISRSRPSRFQPFCADTRTPGAASWFQGAAMPDGDGDGAAWVLPGVVAGLSAGGSKSILFMTSRRGRRPSPSSSRVCSTTSVCSGALGWETSMTWRRTSARSSSSRVARKAAMTLGGELLDEADGVAEEEGGAGGEADAAGYGVEGGKELVGG